jgi:hypothetical protein
MKVLVSRINDCSRIFFCDYISYRLTFRLGCDMINKTSQ